MVSEFNLNGWILTEEKLPKDGEMVLVLDTTLDDILVEFVIFHAEYVNKRGRLVNKKWSLISGGSIISPMFWKREELPDMVKSQFIKENNG